jgi:hypothetical protein
LGSNFTQGNFTYLDSAFNPVESFGINGTIVNGSTPEAVFAPGITSTGAEVDCTF